MDMTIKLKSCKPEIFTVSPEGINEEMVIEIEPLCECDCAVNTLNTVNTVNTLNTLNTLNTVNTITQEDKCDFSECNNSGHLICGVCQCCGDSYGENCR